MLQLYTHLVLYVLQLYTHLVLYVLQLYIHLVLYVLQLYTHLALHLAQLYTHLVLYVLQLYTHLALYLVWSTISTLVCGSLFCPAKLIYWRTFSLQYYILHTQVQILHVFAILMAFFSLTYAVIYQHSKW